MWHSARHTHARIRCNESQAGAGLSRTPRARVCVRVCVCSCVRRTHTSARCTQASSHACVWGINTPHSHSYPGLTNEYFVWQYHRLSRMLTICMFEHFAMFRSVKKYEIKFKKTICRDFVPVNGFYMSTIFTVLLYTVKKLIY